MSLLAFVAGVALGVAIGYTVGWKRGYQRGLRDGNPFIALNRALQRVAARFAAMRLPLELESVQFSLLPLRQTSIVDEAERITRESSDG